jgi:GTPase SAR1 family protein
MRYCWTRRLQRLRPLAYTHAHVVVIGFNIDNRESLVNVQHKWIPEVNEYCPGTPIILIRLKKDLRKDLFNIEEMGEKGLDFVKPTEGRLLHPLWKRGLRGVTGPQLSEKCRVVPVDGPPTSFPRHNPSRSSLG